MELASFYNNVEVRIDISTDLGKRLKSLLDNVVSRLPEEPQFRISGRIVFKSRLGAMKYWQRLLSDFKKQRLPPCKPPSFDNLGVDGHSSFAPRISPKRENKLDHSFYILTFVTDTNGGMLDKTDNYVKGLIAHEFAEMSYKYRRIEKALPQLLTMEDYDARNNRIREVCFGGFDADDPRYPEHEAIADKEAIRLGFAEEIKALREDLKFSLERRFNPALLNISSFDLGATNSTPSYGMILDAYNRALEKRQRNSG